MLARLVRHPLPYLLLLLALTYLRVEANGWLRPEITNDTQSYEHLLKATTVAEALSGLRTYGYPLVIRIFGLEDDGWAAVPRFHFALYALAVLLFWAAVSRFTRSPWLAFAAAAPLCFAAALAHVRLVVTDSIAESLGLVAVALLLLLAASRRWLVLAVLLGLTVFLIVWIRPIYQFLVVLVPLSGVVLRICHDPQRRVAVWRWSLGLAALTIVPFVTMAAVRWSAVGEFAVSSFSGYHIGSIGALMLDEELVDEMPAEGERLAREILAERRRRGLEPMRLGSWSGRYQAREFGLTMFDIAEPIATTIVLEEEGRVFQPDRSTDLGPLDIPGMMGPTAIEIDRRLGALGRAAIRARPLVYAKWVVDAVRMGVAKTMDEPLVPWLLALLGLSIPVLLMRGARDPALLARPWSGRVLGLVGLALVAGLYFLGHTMVVALVHWPKDRYAAAAGILLPALLAACLFELWRWILPSGPEPRPDRPGRLASVGGALLLVAVGVATTEAVFRMSEFDFDRQEERLARVPIFSRWPSRPTGSVFFHRPGPAVWRGPVLAGGAEVEVPYDADGFRNPPELADWEIVVVGDGFVEAGYLPAEELFTAELARQTGRAVKNLGARFTGPLTHIHYLETWGASAGTRIAVLVFNEGDDLDDIEREASDLYWFERDGRRREHRSLTPQSSLVRAVFRPLLAPRAEADAWWTRAHQEPPANADLLLPARDEALRVHVFERVPGRRDLPPERRERLDEVLRRWAEAARGLGLEPWLLYMPCKHRVYKQYLRYDDDVPARVRDWRPSDLPDLVRGIAAASGIGFLDPGPRLANAAAAGVQVYNPIDPHLSELGSRYVGRVVAARLAAAAGEP